MPTFSPRPRTILTLPKMPVWAGKNYKPGAHADFKPEDLVFRREQSQKLRQATWEARMKPLRSWCELAALGIFFAVFMMACIFMATL